jgi:bifunctional non-homologous end joining protein LigD
MKTWNWHEVNDDGVQHSYVTHQDDNGRFSCNCPGFGRSKTANGKSTCRHTRKIELNGESLVIPGASSSLASVPYEEGTWGSVSAPAVTPVEINDLKPQLLRPITEGQVQLLIDNPNFAAQEKMDGKRIILDCRGSEPIAINKLGKLCEIPDDIKEAAKVKLHGCAVDGELIDGNLYIYDFLWNGTDLRAEPYQSRYYTLRSRSTLPEPGHETEDDLLRVCPLAVTKAQKEALFARLKAEKREGIVFKKLTAEYRAERNPDMLKFKFVESVSCLVLQHNAKSSIRLGLKGNSPGQTKYIGNCTIPQGMKLPPVGSIVEIRYLYAYEGGSLFQPVFLGVRDDTDVDTLAQLKYKHKFTGTAAVEGSKAVPKVDVPKPSGLIRRKIQWR